MDAHLRMLAVGVHTISTDESVLCMVEHMKHSLVERQSGPEHGGNHQFVFRQCQIGRSQWSLHKRGLKGECLRNLISHDFADSPDVVAEERVILLILNVPDFCHILAEHGVLF